MTYNPKLGLVPENISDYIEENLSTETVQGMLLDGEILSNPTNGDLFLLNEDKTIIRRIKGQAYYDLLDHIDRSNIVVSENEEYINESDKLTEVNKSSVVYYDKANKPADIITEAYNYVIYIMQADKSIVPRRMSFITRVEDIEIEDKDEIRLSDYLFNLYSKNTKKELLIEKIDNAIAYINNTKDGNNETNALLISNKILTDLFATINTELPMLPKTTLTTVLENLKDYLNMTDKDYAAENDIAAANRAIVGIGQLQEYLLTLKEEDIVYDLDEYYNSALLSRTSYKTMADSTNNKIVSGRVADVFTTNLNNESKIRAIIADMLENDPNNISLISYTKAINTQVVNTAGKLTFKFMGATDPSTNLTYLALFQKIAKNHGIAETNDKYPGKYSTYYRFRNEYWDVWIFSYSSVFIKPLTARRPSPFSVLGGSYFGYSMGNSSDENVFRMIHGEKLHITNSDILDIMNNKSTVSPTIYSGYIVYNYDSIAIEMMKMLRYNHYGNNIIISNMYLDKRRSAIYANSTDGKLYGLALKSGALPEYKVSKDFDFVESSAEITLSMNKFKEINCGATVDARISYLKSEIITDIPNALESDIADRYCSSLYNGAFNSIFYIMKYIFDTNKAGNGMVFQYDNIINIEMDSDSSSIFVLYNFENTNMMLGISRSDVFKYYDTSTTTNGYRELNLIEFSGCTDFKVKNGAVYCINDYPEQSLFRTLKKFVYNSDTNSYDETFITASCVNYTLTEEGVIVRINDVLKFFPHTTGDTSSYLYNIMGDGHAYIRGVKTYSATDKSFAVVYDSKSYDMFGNELFVGVMVRNDTSGTYEITTKDYDSLEVFKPATLVGYPDFSSVVVAGVSEILLRDFFIILKLEDGNYLVYGDTIFNYKNTAVSVSNIPNIEGFEELIVNNPKYFVDIVAMVKVNGVYCPLILDYDTNKSVIDTNMTEKLDSIIDTKIPDYLGNYYSGDVRKMTRSELFFNGLEDLELDDMYIHDDSHFLVYKKDNKFYVLSTRTFPFYNGKELVKIKHTEISGSTFMFVMSERDIEIYTTNTNIPHISNYARTSFNTWKITSQTTNSFLKNYLHNKRSEDMDTIINIILENIKSDTLRINNGESSMMLLDSLLSLVSSYASLRYRVLQELVYCLNNNYGDDRMTGNVSLLKKDLQYIATMMQEEFGMNYYGVGNIKTVFDNIKLMIVELTKREYQHKVVLDSLYADVDKPYEFYQPMIYKPKMLQYRGTDLSDLIMNRGGAVTENVLENIKELFAGIPKYVSDYTSMSELRIQVNNFVSKYSGLPYITAVVLVSDNYMSVVTVEKYLNDYYVSNTYKFYEVNIRKHDIVCSYHTSTSPDILNKYSIFALSTSNVFKIYSANGTSKYREFGVVDFAIATNSPVSRPAYYGDNHVNEEIYCETGTFGGFTEAEIAYDNISLYMDYFILKETGEVYALKNNGYALKNNGYTFEKLPLSNITMNGETVLFKNMWSNKYSKHIFLRDYDNKLYKIRRTGEYTYSIVKISGTSMLTEDSTILQYTDTNGYTRPDRLSEYLDGGGTVAPAYVYDTTIPDKEVLFITYEYVRFMDRMVPIIVFTDGTAVSFGTKTVNLCGGIGNIKDILIHADTICYITKSSVGMNKKYLNSDIFTSYIHEFPILEQGTAGFSSGGMSYIPVSTVFPEATSFAGRRILRAEFKKFENGILDDMNSHIDFAKTVYVYVYNLEGSFPFFKNANGGKIDNDIDITEFRNKNNSIVKNDRIISESDRCWFPYPFGNELFGVDLIDDGYVLYDAIYTKYIDFISAIVTNRQSIMKNYGMMSKEPQKQINAKLPKDIIEYRDAGYVYTVENMLINDVDVSDVEIIEPELDALPDENLIRTRSVIDFITKFEVYIDEVLALDYVNILNNNDIRLSFEYKIIDMTKDSQPDMEELYGVYVAFNRARSVFYGDMINNQMNYTKTYLSGLDMRINTHERFTELNKQNITNIPFIHNTIHRTDDIISDITNKAYMKANHNKVADNYETLSCILIILQDVMYEIKNINTSDNNYSKFVTRLTNISNSMWSLTKGIMNIISGSNITPNYIINPLFLHDPFRNEEFYEYVETIKEYCGDLEIDPNLFICDSEIISSTSPYIRNVSTMRTYIMNLTYSYYILYRIHKMIKNEYMAKDYLKETMDVELNLKLILEYCHMIHRIKMSYTY